MIEACNVNLKKLACPIQGHPQKEAQNRNETSYSDGLAVNPVMSVESSIASQENYTNGERDFTETSSPSQPSPEQESKEPEQEPESEKKPLSPVETQTSPASSPYNHAGPEYLRDFARPGKAYSPKDSILQREAQRLREERLHQQQDSEENKNNNNSPFRSYTQENSEATHTSPKQDFLEKLHQQVERINSGFQSNGGDAKRQLFNNSLSPHSLPSFSHQPHSHDGHLSIEHSSRKSPNPRDPNRRISSEDSLSPQHQQGSFQSSPRSDFGGSQRDRSESFTYGSGRDRVDSFNSPSRFLAPPPLQRPDIGPHFSPRDDSKGGAQFPDYYIGPQNYSHTSEGEFFFCHLCSFVGNSKYLFNAHMNSHFEHRCPHCDYTSRTEGRLKRHIKDFHSDSPPENYSGNQATMRSTPGRPKVFKCKQCEFSSTDKIEFWEHARIHIKDEKVLQCPKCPFVTEYKHHLEYHLRNHFGSKPFKCQKCNYSCVNKSMLNSHMKSHTNVYQYRCADCTYATKYCHSLKLHLKKYSHKPATVLNPDGSLPTDGSGDFELVSKRGPPRGPRGPRKDGKEDSPPAGSSPMGAGFMPSSPARNFPPAPPPGFWPMLPNGIYPPPLLPVQGMPGLPMMENGKHPLPPTVASSMAAMAAMVTEQERSLMAESSGKCSMCEYRGESREALQHHMMRVHAAENQDLFKALGVKPDSLMEEQRKSPMNGTTPLTTSPQALPPSAMDLVRPHLGQEIKREQKVLYARDLAAAIENEALSNGESPLDLTAATSPNQPMKRKASDDESSPASGSLSPTPRKRSRKGKAYKLDTLCLKLQERYSPDVNQDDLDYASDYAPDKPTEADPEKASSGEVSRDQTSEEREAGMSETAMKHKQMAALLSKGKDGETSTEMSNGAINGFDLEERRLSLEERRLSLVEEGGEEAVQRMLEISTAMHRQRSLNPLLPEGSPGKEHMRDDVMGHAEKVVPNSGNLYECTFCDISFKDCIMYTMHMGYHGYREPFKCNMCGHSSDNRVQFFLHIARAAHE